MEDFGKAKLEFFKTFLELPNGIPDEKTFARLFARINPIELAACLGREVMREDELEWMGSRGKRKDLKTIIQYWCTRVEGGKTTETRHYYLSSRSLDAEEAGRLIRGHWSIENRPQWFLDVCFGEDGYRVRTNHATENLNVLRKTGIPEKRFGLSRKMLRATLSDDFPHDVLFGKAKRRCPGGGAISIDLGAYTC
jgi:predicted transposase YbfD/YdcC